MFKDPKIPLDDRSHGNGSKDANIIVLGSKGVGKTGLYIPVFS